MIGVPARHGQPVIKGAEMADIRIEEKSRKGLPNWLLILITITIALVVWWYITRMA